MKDALVHLLLTQPLPDAIDQQLEANYVVHRLYQQTDPNRLFDEFGPLIQGVVTGGAKGLDNATMDRLPALKIIAISGIGTDAVDLVHAARRNIAVTTTPGVLTDDVADMAFGLLIATLRRMSEAEAVLRGPLAANAAAAGAQGNRHQIRDYRYGPGGDSDCPARRSLSYGNLIPQPNAASGAAVALR